MTEGNLIATGRTKEPVRPEDHNYYLEQLVVAGKLSVSECVRRYKRDACGIPY